MATTTDSTMIVNTKGARLNLRESPSMAARILAKLRHGEKITVIQRMPSGWALVATKNGNSGWVQDGFLVL